jgi:hypothetical protein
MSAVCVLAPVVVAAWPGFSAAVVAAAGSLGYTVAEESVADFMCVEKARRAGTTVQLDIPQSEIVTGQLGRDQRISVCRDGVTVTFSRDACGRAGLCVTGRGRGEEELRTAGEELSRRVVQQYVYQRLTEEVLARGYVIAEETTDASQAIHLRIRHWEN